MKEEEPSSASKTVKIAHQQTLDCYFFLNSSLRTQIYNSTSKHQFIINFETTRKTMFRTPYLVRIKVSIFNSLLFFLMTVALPSSLLVQIFLLIRCPQVFILPITLNLGWVLEILVFLSWFAKMDTKTPSFLSLRFLQIFDEKRVFMLYNYSYLHLGSIFFKCIIFAPRNFFLLLIIKLYLSFLIISPHNF